MHWFLLVFLSASFELAAADLFIYDQESYVHFTVIGSSDDDISVSPTAFHLGLGMKMEISGKQGLYKLGANDGKVGKSAGIQLTEGIITGRRLPKQMIAFFYGLKSPGVYKFKTQICLNVGHCLPEKTAEVFFSNRDFPMSSEDISK